MLNSEECEKLNPEEWGSQECQGAGTTASGISEEKLGVHLGKRVLEDLQIETLERSMSPYEKRLENRFQSSDTVLLIHKI